MNTFLLSFLLAFIAQFGVKTQFVALTFAARYRLPLVMAAIACSTLTIQLLSVTLVEAVGRLISTLWINLLAGCAFVRFMPQTSVLTRFWLLDSLVEFATILNRFQTLDALM